MKGCLICSVPLLFFETESIHIIPRPTSHITGIPYMHTILHSWWRDCGIDFYTFCYDYELDKESCTTC